MYILCQAFLPLGRISSPLAPAPIRWRTNKALIEILSERMSVCLTVWRSRSRRERRDLYKTKIARRRRCCVCTAAHTVQAARFQTACATWTAWPDAPIHMTSRHLYSLFCIQLSGFGCTSPSRSPLPPTLPHTLTDTHHRWPSPSILHSRRNSGHALSCSWAR